MSLADRADAALQQLYDQVPDVACKGLCADYCGPVSGGSRERARITRAGYQIGDGIDAAMDVVASVVQAGNEDHLPMCAALTDEGRCAAYDLRPMVCRLWGATEALPCPHGCRPVDGEPLLTRAEAGILLQAATNLDMTRPQPRIRP